MPSEDELKTERFQMLLEKSTLSAIDDWGFANRIRTRAEAIRRLVHVGLEHSETQPHRPAVVAAE